jgi:hypothetical protein
MLQIILHNLRLTLTDFLLALALRVIPKDTQEAFLLAKCLQFYLSKVKSLELEKAADKSQGAANFPE